MISAWLVLMLVGTVLLSARAVATGYLVVMHSRRHPLLLLEHTGDQRYHLFAPRMLPLVLLRYLGLSVAYSLLLLRHRMHSWVEARKPVALTAKA